VINNVINNSMLNFDVFLRKCVKQKYDESYLSLSLLHHT